ncbi:MAG: tyrosine--tRNA ligase [Clostridia bacterium]|nr:tyrosine--tRNA ligase [Clostridia bacterium]
MGKNAMDILRERDFIKQVVYEEDLYKLLGSESVSFYIGFDPTADSLHVGHYLAMMAMSHLQKAGHRPIVLVGGGTAMVGDPSGRSDMRSMMTKDTIMANCEAFKVQMSRFFSFEGDNAAVMVNNADWLLTLNYIDFLREIGSCFSVNRMLTADCYKNRMEKGLTFLEFNYMLMQAYDFLVLHDNYGCKLQCGGDDQWSNILAGADLIRRKKGEDAYAMTFQLLTTSAGLKMGKTQAGALWLSREKTSPYDFYQYWRNVDDGDVEKCLKLLTFLPLEEIAELAKFKDERINEAKARLAFEVTRIVHSLQDAQEAEMQAKAAFGGDEENMPSVLIPMGINKIADIMVAAGVSPSKAEAKRLIQGGGVAIDDKKVTNFDQEISDENLQFGFVLHKGKKVHVKITVG